MRDGVQTDISGPISFKLFVTIETTEVYILIPL